MIPLYSDAHMLFNKGDLITRPKHIKSCFTAFTITDLPVMNDARSFSQILLLLENGVSSFKGRRLGRFGLKQQKATFKKKKDSVINNWLEHLIWSNVYFNALLCNATSHVFAD